MLSNLTACLVNTLSMTPHWEHLLARTNSLKNTKQTEKWHTCGIQTDDLATTEGTVEENGTWEIIKKKKKGRDKNPAAQRYSASGNLK